MPFRSPRPIHVALFAATMLLSGPGAAVDTPRSDSDARVETAHVHLVLVPANVTDRRGRTVPGLATEDFRLFEAGRLQQIRFIDSESDLPLSLAFLLDLSGSMRHGGRLERARRAIAAMVARLGAADRAGLIGFADRRVEWITEFTTNRGRFLERLGVQEARGRTALHEALATAPRLVDRARDGRKAIVLFTDGMDNFSRIRLDRAISLARQVDVPVYAIAVLSVRPAHLPADFPRRRLAELDAITRETGGRLFLVHDDDDLLTATRAVGHDLRSRYVIGYYPDNAVADGFRPLRIETASKRWTVRARSGYFLAP